MGWGKAKIPEGMYRNCVFPPVSGAAPLCSTRLFPWEPQGCVVPGKCLPALWPWPRKHTAMLCHGRVWLESSLPHQALLGTAPLCRSVQMAALLAINIPSGKRVSTEDKVKRFRFKGALEWPGYFVVSEAP